MKSSLREHWRISTFRLATLLGVLFTVANIVLLGLIYWQTTSYLEHRIDDSIVVMAGNFKSDGREQVLAQVRDALAYDLRKSNIYGLFGADGRVIAGNMEDFPALPVDGKIHQFNHRTLPQYSPGGVASEGTTGLARAMVKRLAGGDILVVGRDFTQLDEIKAIILNALIFSGTVIVALALLIGFLLSVRPLRRINAVRDMAQRIVHGELSLRLPVSPRNDEVDMLSAIVNRMLEEIERLLTEVKSVTDTLAHDLRTPLTRVRLQLYRMQQQLGSDNPHRQMVDKALTETDALLGRFRALLRISEIENRQRKAGFLLITPETVLEQVSELFDALAEDKSVALVIQRRAAPQIFADPGLLFEALSNLVDNAIKFTPAGGSVTIRLDEQHGAARFDVIDTGCGIGSGEREAVLQRFYRSELTDKHEGYGLGLSIVAAIIHLHGFSLTFHETKSGTHISLVCPPKSSV